MKQTAKEKAQELINRYINLFYHPTEQYLDTDEAKQCALIEVNSIIEVLYSLKFGNALSEEIEYWEAVQQEITKNK